MPDKEPRKRKKRKENQKKDESEDVPQQKEKNHTERSSSEEKSYDIGHEPSVFAKSVFFILFSLLIVAVGLIFFTLHGVQRESWDGSPEPLSESSIEEHGPLNSIVPDDISAHFDNQQTHAETDEIEPSSVQDALENDDVTEEHTTVDPSEMHPWAEHIPQEKPEDQNIFNQIYEALQEELFEDESQEDEHGDSDVDSQAETDMDGEDFMEDSFFKVDDVESDLSERQDSSVADDFSVIVEEVEIPLQQSLLDLQPSEVVPENDDVHVDTEVSETQPQPLETVEVHDAADEIISSQTEQTPLETQENKLPEMEDLDDDDDEEDDDDELEDGDEEKDDGLDELLRMGFEPDRAPDNAIPKDEVSPPEGTPLEMPAAQPGQTDSDDFGNIEWPEEGQKSKEQEILASPESNQNSDVNEEPKTEEEKPESAEHETGDQRIPVEDLNDRNKENTQEDETQKDQENDGPDEPVQGGPEQENVESEPGDNFEEIDMPYENSDVTNDYDFLFKEDIDEADRIVEKSPENALRIFDKLASKHPQSPRVVYGRARSLDRLAEVQRKNSYLDQAIEGYKQVLTLPNVPEALYLQAGNRCVNRLRFRGYIGKALSLQSEMANKYPENTDIQNQLGVSYLWAGKGQIAKTVFQKVLQRNPRSGFAKVHLGFILKTEESKYQESITLMREGIASREIGVIDGRFYFHLGDALARVGRPKQAMLVYEEGVREGVFLSAYQRSLYNVDNLTGKPWWKPEDTPYYSHLQKLEKNWLLIRNEALSLMDDSKKGFIPENEGLRDTGDWKQFELFSRGRKIEQNCQRAPRTCALVEAIPDASGCKRGQVKFSIMQPGTHVWAHTGPTNCRIRAHLGLVVPEGPRLRVANETKTWTEGKIIIFDDSFEHEVWHDGQSFRLVLIADFWHPELTSQQKASLSPI